MTVVSQLQQPLLASQAEFLLGPRSLKEEDHLQTIFRELLFLRILKLKVEWKALNRKRPKKRRYILISRGPAWEQGSQAPQHQMMLDFFKAHKQMLLSFFLKRLMKKVSKEEKLSNLTHRSLKGSGLVNDGFFFWKTRLFTRKKEGKTKALELKNSLTEARNQIRQLKDQESSKLLEKLKLLGPHVLLLEEFNDELRAELNNRINMDILSQPIHELNPLDHIYDSAFDYLIDYLIDTNQYGFSFDSLMDSISSDISLGMGAEFGVEGFDISFDWS